MQVPKINNEFLVIAGENGDFHNRNKILNIFWVPNHEEVGN